MDRSNDLPPIAGKLPGVKSRRTYGDRVLFTVEPVSQRAGSVPLRNAPTATLAHRQKQVERYFATATQDPAMRGIVGWTKTLEDEKRSFPSTSMWCELMLNKVIKETQHMPAPNTLRTAVCCMLLHRLCPMLGHCEQLMSSLLFEVFSAIYVDWPEYMARKFVDFSHHEKNAEDPAAPTSAPNDSSVLTLKNEYDADALDAPQSGRKFLVAALHQRSTYFSSYETLQKARMHVLGAPSRCIGRCINVWIRSLLFIIFSFWRSEARTATQRHVKATGIVDRIFLTKSRNRLKVHFTAWRKVTMDRQNLFAQEHTQQKLVQRMGRRIQELEAENGSLKQQFSSLLSEHREVGKRLQQMNAMLANFRRPLGELLGEGKKPLSAEESDEAGAENEEKSLASVVSFAEAVDPDEVFKLEVYRENDNSLLPKPKSRRRRSSSSASFHCDGTVQFSHSSAAGPPTQSITPPVVDTAAIEEVTHRPNRVKQLSDFLALDPETIGVDRPSELVPKVAVMKETKTVVLPNYTDVLDWISVRTQLLNITASTFAKRVSNFTMDFKDGLRLACLLVTIGADKSLLEEATGMAPMARAGLSLRAAMCFLLPDDSFFEDAQAVQPVDLIKGKGNKVSRLFFALYDKYKLVPLEVTAGHLEPDVMRQLVENGFMKEVTKQALMNASALGMSMGGASMEMSCRSPAARSARDATESEEMDASINSTDYISDAQFLHWFRDLAASDSDEDLDNFASMQQSVLDASSVCGSVAKSLERRLSRSSLSFVRKDTAKDMGETMNSWSTSRAKSKRRTANGALVSQWVKEKMTSTHPELLDPSREVHPMDALEAVLEAMFPKLAFGGRDLGTRIKRMETALHNKLHLTHVRLDGGKSTATANQQMAEMPVRQLLMFLYLIDKGAVMSR
jgi:hypothetical protein